MPSINHSPKEDLAIQLGAAAAAENTPSVSLQHESDGNYGSSMEEMEAQKKLGSGDDLEENSQEISVIVDTLKSLEIGVGEGGGPNMDDESADGERETFLIKKVDHSMGQKIRIDWEE